MMWTRVLKPGNLPKTTQRISRAATELRKKWADEIATNRKEVKHENN